MRFSPVVISILLSLPCAPGALRAQAATAGATAPRASSSQGIPADWALSMQAKMMRQLAQERQQTIAALHACPVGFAAERHGNWGLESTKTASGSPAQGLDLSFHAWGHSVVEADITVHGWTNQLRMVPAAYPQQTTESFALSGTNDAPLVQELVWMKRLGVVNSVELTRVVFSDGTSWSQSVNAHCTVRPGKLMYVNASPQPK